MNKNTNTKQNFSKNNQVDYSPSVWTIDKLRNKFKFNKLKINPNFQRKYVWKDNEIKDKLMQSIFLGYPIGVFTFWESENFTIVVDGQQRISTILKFVDENKSIYDEDDYSTYKRIQKSTSKLIIESHIDSINQDAESNDKNAIKIIKNYEKGIITLLTFKNLSNSLKILITSYELSINSIRQANEKQIRNYFSIVQNREKLKGGELINAIQENEITLILSKRNNNHEKHLKYILFKNDRNDFVKIATLYHGLISEKLKFGVSDKHIVKYAEKMTHNNSFNDRFIKFLNMLSNVNFKINQTDRSFNKLAMKILLGIAFLKTSYIKSSEHLCDIIQKIYAISDQVSKFNSLKRKDKVNRKIRYQYRTNCDNFQNIS